MKFIDLDLQYRRLQNLILQRINAVLEHGQYIRGPEIQELEIALAKRTEVRHCIALASGTTALQVALMALGIKPGDEVITTPFSFFATVETILLLGAVPVFVDIDFQTYNLDPQLLEKAITPKTRAIMPVDLYGQCANYDAISKIAAKYHLPVIEDAAQSFGATYHRRPAGGLATIGCTSFFPSKPLGCYGDGGACFTNDDELANRIRLIIDHGQSQRYTHTIVGINGRLDTVQAAILLAKLSVFEEEIKRRSQVAAWYAERLAGVLPLPFIAPGNSSVYAQYTVQVEDRALVQKQLQAEGIPTAVHYPKPLHQQDIFAGTATASLQLPVSEAAARRVLSLPFHPYLQKEQVEKIAENLGALILTPAS